MRSLCSGALSIRADSTKRGRFVLFIDDVKPVKPARGTGQGSAGGSVSAGSGQRRAEPRGERRWSGRRRRRRHSFSSSRSRGFSSAASSASSSSSRSSRSFRGTASLPSSRSVSESSSASSPDEAPRRRSSSGFLRRGADARRQHQQQQQQRTAAAAAAAPPRGRGSTGIVHPAAAAPADGTPSSQTISVSERVVVFAHHPSGSAVSSPPAKPQQQQQPQPRASPPRSPERQLTKTLPPCVPASRDPQASPPPPLPQAAWLSVTGSNTFSLVQADLALDIPGLPRTAFAELFYGPDPRGAGGYGGGGGDAALPADLRAALARDLH
eukprot:Rhum_TRINITY_DN14899_c8_g1::Rhum_TRINITY_DN14899_c8_g1_i2::g.125534::m.125534